VSERALRPINAKWLYTDEKSTELAERVSEWKDFTSDQRKKVIYGLEKHRMSEWKDFTSEQRKKVIYGQEKDRVRKVSEWKDFNSEQRKKVIYGREKQS